MSTISVTPVVDQAAVATYLAGDAKVKAQVRTMLGKRRDAAVDALDMQGAADAKATLDACKSPSSRSTKAPTDYGQVVAQRIVDLRAAAAYLESGTFLPEGIDQARMTAATSTPLAEIDLDAVEISDEARRIAEAKVTRSDLRRSIQAVYERAFDAAEEADEDFGGWLSCSEIARLGAVEGYAPSSGAVAARLVDKHGADKEVTLVGFDRERSDDGTLGAVRV